MKKTILTLMAATAIITGAQAQARKCGTMVYLELRKQQDPMVEKRMKENEKQMQEWIKEHPVHHDFETAAIHLPSIPGFHPTGNTNIDRINYTNAKAQHVSNIGSATVKPAMDNETVRNRREQKRKSNTFIQK